MGKPGAQQSENNGNTNTDDNNNDQIDSGKKPAPGAQEDGGDDADVPEEFLDPKKAFKEIQNLRKEAAKHRTKAKSLEEEVGGVKSTLEKLKKAITGEDENVDPEEQLKQLKQRNEILEVEMSIGHLARENDIPSDQDDYFRFLLNQKFEALKDGEELSEEDLQEVIGKVQKVAGTKTPKRNSTGVSEEDGANGGNPPPSNGKTTITAEQFVQMTLAEKGKVFTDDNALYNRLLSEAKSKRLI